MLVHTDIPIKHFKSLPRYEPQAIDSSALMEFKRCPLAYFFRYVLGFTDKEEPVYFAWGSAYHKYREVLELEFKKGNDNTSGTNLDMYSAQALGAAMKLWGTRQNPFPGSKFAHVTKERLITACLESHKSWKGEKLRGNIVVLQTEQPFNITLPNGVNRSGRFDQVILWNSRVWGRDFKTTTKDWKYFQRTFWPNDQFTGYTYAQKMLTGKPVAGQLVEAVINRAPTKTEERIPEIQSQIVTINDSQLDTWLNEQLYWDKSLKMARENDLYPKNEKSCGWCPYHQVCQGSNEMAQETILKAQYKVRVWDNSYENESEE